MNVEYPIPNEDLIRLAEKEEPRFLHILLKDKESLQDAISFGIKRTKEGVPGHFIVPKNNMLFAMIQDNFEKYGTLLTRGSMDSIMDSQDFGSDEHKSSIKSHWDKVWNHSAVSMSDYKLLREHLNDRYVAWQFYDKWQVGDEIVKSTVGHTEKVKKFIRDIATINNLDNDDVYDKTVALEDGIQDAIDFITKRREYPDDSDVIRCGIRVLDDIYNGFERGSYTVISGMINGGKTTLMMNMGFNMAKMGYNVAYVSLEKKASIFYRKILSLHAAVDYNRIKRGGNRPQGLSDIWYNKFKEAAKDLIDNIKPRYHCLQFVQKTKLTKILSEVDKLRSQNGKIDVLIVDYLQVIGFETFHSNRPDIDLADVHQRLMAYGREHNMVTITALQLKGSSSKEIRKRIQKVSTEQDVASLMIDPEDFSGSQMIIADADNALGVMLNGDHPPSKMFIAVSKARDDESRGVKTLDFDGKISRVSDPICDPGQIEAVDKEIYGSKNENELSTADDLFSGNGSPVEIDEKMGNLIDAAIDQKPIEIKKEDVSENDSEEIFNDKEKEKEIEDEKDDTIDDKKSSGNVEVEDGNIDDLW